MCRRAVEFQKLCKSGSVPVWIQSLLTQVRDLRTHELNCLAQGRWPTVQPALAMHAKMAHGLERAAATVLLKRNVDRLPAAPPMLSAALQGRKARACSCPAVLPSPGESQPPAKKGSRKRRNDVIEHAAKQRKFTDSLRRPEE